jgi:hypothetical protein
MALLLEGTQHEVRPDGKEAAHLAGQIWGKRKMDRITTSMTTMSYGDSEAQIDPMTWIRCFRG